MGSSLAGEMAFVSLDGGVFRMGAEIRDEGPEHLVRVHGFLVAAAPVTNRQYDAFVRDTEHEASPFSGEPRFNAPDCPVVGISWFDAVDYCAWLSEQLGRVCRLPTEAEREYAARGGVEAVQYPWGDEPWDSGPHAFGAAGGDRPHPVGSTEPNGYGLFHMADNVHEWCSDWYSAGYDVTGMTLDDPRGPVSGERRSSRGGSWRHYIKVSRITSRSSLSPDRRYNDYGFRVYAEL